MSQKSSTFVRETRDRETWLESAAPGDGEAAKERERLLAVAALMRGTAETIEVPEAEEERARSLAVAEMQRLHLERLQHQAPRPPWYLRFGRAMRYVFTLGRRR
jgi:hypothetical protein